MEIQLEQVPIERKEVLRRLIELYLYDYSEFDGADLDEGGEYGYKYFDQYWIEASRIPLIVLVKGRIAGFALVRRLSPVDMPPYHSLAEFFILRKYRRQGVGRQVAHLAFDRFPGKWWVAQEDINSTAIRFWRRVVGDYTEGRYQEVRRDDGEGPAQVFESRPSG